MVLKFEGKDFVLDKTSRTGNYIESTLSPVKIGR